MQKIFSYCLAFLFFIHSSAAVPDFRFIHYDRENSGLSHNGIRTIAEDASGNLWIGTFMGLSRYDGEKFTSWDKVNFGVASDYVSSVCEDQDGNIWVGTDAGIVLYEKKSGGFRDMFPGRLDTRIYTMKMSDDGLMWIGTRGMGLYCFSRGQLFRPAGAESLVNPYCITVCDGRIIVADYCQDVYVYDGKTLTPLAGGYFLNDDVEGLALREVAGGSILYVASKSHGICEVAMSTETVRKVCDLPPDERPLDLEVDGEYAYISTTGGLLCRNLCDGTSSLLQYDANDRFSISDNNVRTTFRDSKGGLWVGTEFGGLNYFNPLGRHFRKYYMTSDGTNLNGAIVKGFARAADGRMWIATERAGLFYLDSEERLCRYKSSYLPSSLSSICAHGDCLLLGSHRGVWRLNPSDGSVRHYFSFRREGVPVDSRVVSLFEAADGKVYAGASVGVMLLDEENGVFNEIPALSGITAEDMKQDSRGIIWIASYSQGAYSYNPETESLIAGYNIQDSSSTVHEMTSTMCIDNAGNPWVIGYTSGFYRYVSGRFECVSKASNTQLPTDLFLCALQDSRGRLWMSTDSGLVEYAAADEDGNVGTGAARVFTTSDGLLANDYTKAAFRLNDSTFFFGSADGFVRFNPLDFDDPALPDPVPFWRSVYGVFTMVASGVLLVLLIVFLVVYRGARARDRRRELERETRRESETYREKLNFFSGIIHEIKTPLTLIRTPLQSLMNSSLNSDQNADLMVIKNSTDYLDSLVRELLDFISVQEHGYALNMRNADIADKIDFILFNFRESARSRNISIEFDHPGDSVVTAVDSKAFNKIMNNLLDNALKYGETYVRVCLKVEDGNVRISVANDGPGIPENRRENIFKPFVRFDAGDCDYSSSFGIGLSLARKLAELHSGSLILSDRTDFTEFVLTIPVKQASETITEDMESEVTSSSLPLLLVTEDNAELSGYIKGKLSSSYRVLRAASAEKALELLHKYKIDLMLTDIGLQGMSGVDLCRRVSADPELSHIPVIVISAISSVDVKIKCVESGATVYIEKPFSMDYLEACIKGVLGKRRSIKEAYSETPQGADIELQDRDLDFIRRFDRIVTENLSDPAFTKKQIEDQMFISKSSLSRKVASLLNNTPNGYIRDKRLQTAADLLARGNVRVSDVCYAVGFNSSSYFAKCFKQKYGKLPAEYMEENRQNEL